MPRLRRLSARQDLTILRSFGFAVVSVRGSHAKLGRERDGRPAEILTIPLHRELAPGTIQAIYHQALRFIPDAELRPYFYAND